MGTSSATASSGPVTINHSNPALMWGLVIAGLALALLLILPKLGEK